MVADGYEMPIVQNWYQRIYKEDIRRKAMILIHYNIFLFGCCIKLFFWNI